MLWGDKAEFIDKLHPGLAFVGARRAGCGGQKLPLIAGRNSLGQFVERQGAEVVDHWNVIRQGRSLCQTGQGGRQGKQKDKGDAAEHDAIMTRIHQMETKQGIGVLFRQRALEPDSPDHDMITGRSSERKTKMSRQRLASTAAMIALIAGLAMPAMAQVSNGDLPAPLAALNLNNLRSETGRDGIREVEGLTADGVEIEAQIDMAGNLLKVDADDGALPAMLIEALVPQAARDHEAFGLFVRIDEIKQHAGHIEIEGRQANGEDIEAIFDPENRLVKLDLDDTVIPASLVAAMLPQAVRNAEAFGQFAGIQEIHSRPGFVGLQGTDGTGEEMKAMFDEEGRLLRFGRDEDKGPRAWRGRGGDDDDRRRGPERQMWRDGADMEQQRGAHMRPGGATTITSAAPICVPVVQTGGQIMPWPRLISTRLRSTGV